LAEPVTPAYGVRTAYAYDLLMPLGRLDETAAISAGTSRTQNGLPFCIGLAQG